ncbi:auxin efflux carrier [Treponema sp.]
MPSFAAGLIPVLFLIALGAILGKVGFLREEMVAGLKKIVSSVALPALLFGAFSHVKPDLAFISLALIIFASCALMGFFGSIFSRLFHLPHPATTFLFEGFEAGMLGYALFAALFGKMNISTFATADLGQVLFVFIVLLSQMKASETERERAFDFAAFFKRLISSPPLIAILLGIAASLLAPGAQSTPWGEGGFLIPLLDTVGSLTTPLVCLVVGYGLISFSLSDSLSTLITVVLRFALALLLGGLTAFIIVPLLGFGKLQSIAVLALFILPPPFVIPVFRTKRGDAAYISAVLSLHTVVSLLAFIILAAFYGAVGA